MGDSAHPSPLSVTLLVGKTKKELTTYAVKYTKLLGIP